MIRLNPPFENSTPVFARGHLHYAPEGAVERTVGVAVVATRRRHLLHQHVGGGQKIPGARNAQLPDLVADRGSVRLAVLVAEV